MTPRPLATFADVLDFGCGGGRLTRRLPGHTQAVLSGSDYNNESVGWCAENLPCGCSSTNQLVPPTSFSDGSFDLILARSVFTHLPEAGQVVWTREFERLLRPGGYLYVTLHGKALTSGLDEDRQRDFDAGRLVATYETLAGQNLYSTYASPSFVTQTLLRSFSLVRYVPGRQDPHLRQDVYVLARNGDPAPA